MKISLKVEIDGEPMATTMLCKLPDELEFDSPWHLALVREALVSSMDDVVEEVAKRTRSEHLLEKSKDL